MKKLSLIVLLLSIQFAKAQVWPSSSWNGAANMATAMDSDGVTDMSGLHFNPVNNRLYCVRGDGHLRVLQYNTTTFTFTQIADKSISGGPEGITQANLNANEFYTIDENNYEIRRYTHTSNFSSTPLLRRWNLLLSPSPMQETGNTGPEGIVFVPDSALLAAGFVSQQTGQPYTSTKGAGGLFFVAHQDEGYVWVFDLNPNANNDFLYVGKYKTDLSESCDLSFDRSTGLLYILHNVDDNKLEVTDLSTTVVSGNERKFNVSYIYDIPNPTDGNVNIEGFALMPKCPGSTVQSAWLCRDVESDEDESIQNDVLRWFYPFTPPGTCDPLADEDFTALGNISVAPNPSHSKININGKIGKADIQIINALGQIVLKIPQMNTANSIDIAALENGVYFLEIESNGSVSRVKWIKN